MKKIYDHQMIKLVLQHSPFFFRFAVGDVVVYKIWRGVKTGTIEACNLYGNIGYYNPRYTIRWGEETFDYDDIDEDEITNKTANPEAISALAKLNNQITALEGEIQKLKAAKNDLDFTPTRKKPQRTEDET